MGSGPGLYDRTGHGYDATRRADPYIVRRLAEYLAPAQGGNYLDLACGTGNYTAALAGLAGRWHGVDRSPAMVRQGLAKSPQVAWRLADAANLPFTDGAFSGAVCTLAVHHFADVPGVCQEVRRVLSGGRFVVFTATPDQMRGYWLNHYFPAAIRQSIIQMPGLDRLETDLRLAGFGSVRTEPYSVPPDLQDLFLYSGKHRPEIYLDQAVRAGISTFASLADPGEVAEGCQRLAQDIRSGGIKAVMSSYEREGGDYLFVVAET